MAVSTRRGRPATNMFYGLTNEQYGGSGRGSTPIPTTPRGMQVWPGVSPGTRVFATVECSYNDPDVERTDATLAEVAAASWSFEHMAEQPTVALDIPRRLSR